MSTPIIESVAKVLVVNPDNQVLVLTLSEHRQKPEKSFTPDLPGGLVDPGESDYDGAIREVLEETGLSLNLAPTVPVYSETQYFPIESKSVTKHLFVIAVSADQVSSIELSWEHSAYSWVNLEDLTSTSFGVFYDKAIAYCMEHNLLDL